MTGCVVHRSRATARRSVAVLLVLLSAAAWGLCHLFSGRGAFIQFGAMLGTIMVANVFFVIIPGQREMVRAKREGREPDPQHGIRGKLRSVHNTYFTLPVLFTMISHHYAMTYGATYNWLVLIAISMAGVLIRVYFVSRHKAHERGGRTSPVPAVLGVVTLAAVAFVLAPGAGRMLRLLRRPTLAARRNSRECRRSLPSVACHVMPRGRLSRGSSRRPAMCCWIRPSTFGFAPRRFVSRSPRARCRSAI